VGGVMVVLKNCVRYYDVCYSITTLGVWKNGGALLVH